METYIEHHGILGQKWGVRRYQNPDGTLTSAGKQRAKEKTPMSAEAKRRVAKYIAGGTAATAAIALGMVYATNPAVRDTVNVLAKTTISSLKESKSKAIEVGKKAVSNLKSKPVINAHEDYLKVHNTTKKLSEMSDAELTSALKRLNMESQYSKLTRKPDSTGKKIAKGTMAALGSVAAATSTGLNVYNNIDRINKILNQNKKH